MEQSSNVSSTDEIDPNVPSIARVYDVWLGGKDHFSVDRALADQMATLAPSIPEAARENRGFLRRVVRHLTAVQGIDQYLDIGSGLPTAENVHQVAQRISPLAKVVYVDNDPTVLAQGGRMLVTDDNTKIIRGDIRDPAAILADPTLASTLAMDRPVAVLLLALLQFVPDENEAYGSVAHLVDAMAPGSFLVVSHIEERPEFKETAPLYSSQAAPFQLRTSREILRFFDGLEMLPPGLVPVDRWRPEANDGSAGGGVPLLGGVAYKK
jgi:hypothetical protein